MGRFEKRARRSRYSVMKYFQRISNLYILVSLLNMTKITRFFLWM